MIRGSWLVISGSQKRMKLNLCIYEPRATNNYFTK